MLDQPLYKSCSNCHGSRRFLINVFERIAANPQIGRSSIYPMDVIARYAANTDVGSVIAGTLS
jgi:hypothetical protein